MKRKLYGWIVVSVHLLTMAGSVWAQDQAAAGAQVTQADWTARLPLVALTIVFVLVVDAAFVIPIRRKLRQQAASRSRN